MGRVGAVRSPDMLGQPLLDESHNLEGTDVPAAFETLGKPIHFVDKSLMLRLVGGEPGIVGFAISSSSARKWVTV